MPAFALHVDSCKKLFDHFKLRRESLNFALVTLGSVIVDLEEFGILKNVHGKSEAFLKHLLATDPKYAPLALGMIMHEELDAVIDKHHVNKNIPAAKELLEHYKFSTNKVSLAAHYLVDHTVNCLFIETKPETIALADTVKKRLTTKHAHKIAFHLAEYFDGDEKQLLNALHTFKEFDLQQYLSPDSSAALYAKFLFLQEELADKKPVKLLDKIKLGLHYSKFIFGHRKEQTKELYERAKEKFTDHKGAYKKAFAAMRKRMSKISAAYAFTLK